MKQVFFLFVCFHLTLFSAFSGGWSEEAADSAPGQAITVFAAASTINLIEEAVQQFKSATGIEVHINAASSGTLAMQIEEGAPADIYISASKAWMDYTSDLGLVKERRPFVANKLVVISPIDSDFSWPEEAVLSGDLPEFEGFLSMGDPAHVPAGKYAKESLVYYHWYDALESQILPAADVRAALAVVELSEAVFGIVYKSDAEQSGKVHIAAVLPEESHSPIEYYCSELKESVPEADQLYRFLLDYDKVGDLYLSYGFSLPDSAD